MRGSGTRSTRAAIHLLGTTHHTLSGAPFGWDGTNALNIQVALAYYPTYLAAHMVGQVAAFNLTTLAGYILSGASMYLLTRYLGCRALVAAWAALAYIVFPWHLARIEHASLLHIEVLALLIIALVAVVRRPTWLRFGLVARGESRLLADVGVLRADGGRERRSPLPSARRWRHGRRRVALLALGTAGAALVAPALFGIAAVVSGTNAGAGLNRAAGDLSIYGLRPIELVVPAARNLLLAGHVDSFWETHRHGSNRVETTNYLGLLTFSLALTWLVISVRRWRSLDERVRLATAGLTATFIAGLAFAVPSPIVLFGHRSGRRHASSGKWCLRSVCRRAGMRCS